MVRFQETCICNQASASPCWWDTCTFTCVAILQYVLLSLVDLHDVCFELAVVCSSLIRIAILQYIATLLLEYRCVLRPYYCRRASLRGVTDIVCRQHRRGSHHRVGLGGCCCSRRRHDQHAIVWADGGAGFAHEAAKQWHDRSRGGRRGPHVQGVGDHQPPDVPEVQDVRVTPSCARALASVPAAMGFRPATRQFLAYSAAAVVVVVAFADACASLSWAASYRRRSSASAAVALVVLFVAFAPIDVVTVRFSLAGVACVHACVSAGSTG